MSLQKLALGASGIYLAYCLSGIFSEKLYSHEYPSILESEKPARYIYPDLTVWFSSLFCAFYGIVKSKLSGEKKNPIPTKQQMILGLLYSCNMLCSASSLLYISFLDQAIGRSCRYLTVVIVGVYFSRVEKTSKIKLSTQKIVTAVIITLGVLSFSLSSSSESKPEHIDPENEWKGFLLLTISLIADALLSDNQALFKLKYSPTPNNLFTVVNFWNFIYVFIVGVVRGTALEQISFCFEHPEVIRDLLCIAVLQVLGQVSTYYVVVNFKQNMFPLISATRRVLTVLLSILIFGHSVNARQWLSILVVNLGLSYELYEEFLKKKEVKSINAEKSNSEDNENKKLPENVSNNNEKSNKHL